MTTLPFESLLIGGLVASSFLCFTAMRCPSLLRWYALTSLLIALWAAGLAYRGESSELYAFAVIVILMKVFFLPSFLLQSVRRSGAPLRLQSYLRPAASSFLAIGLLLLALFLLRSIPFGNAFPSTPILTIATFIVLIGMTMMVIRRDTLSVIIAFLQMENGISLFSLATVRDIPLAVEACIFLIVAVGAALFAHLFRHAYAMYGTTDSTALRELID